MNGRDATSVGGAVDFWELGPAAATRTQRVDIDRANVAIGSRSAPMIYVLHRNDDADLLIGYCKR
jgi:hypothetical protein